MLVLVLVVVVLITFVLIVLVLVLVLPGPRRTGGVGFVLGLQVGDDLAIAQAGGELDLAGRTPELDLNAVAFALNLRDPPAGGRLHVGYHQAAVANLQGHQAGVAHLVGGPLGGSG